MKKLFLVIVFLLSLISLVKIPIYASIGVGINTTNEEQISQTTLSGHSLRGYKKSIENQEIIIDSQVWKATDYIETDIRSPTYTVQLGDTLWEIAEGYYGDGFMWRHILSLNLTNIGFLEDGTQALIMPSQILNL